MLKIKKSFYILFLLTAVPLTNHCSESGLQYPTSFMLLIDQIELQSYKNPAEVPALCKELKHYASASSYNYRGISALGYATGRGVPEAVKTLLEAGADLNHLDRNKRYMLTYAIAPSTKYIRNKSKMLEIFYMLTEHPKLDPQSLSSKYSPEKPSLLEFAVVLNDKRLNDILAPHRR